MASLRNKPHVSAALAHLQYGVTGAALMLALCATVQLLLFGIVHFTHLRYAESTHAPAPISIVQPAHGATPSTTAGSNGAILGPTGYTPMDGVRVVGEVDPSLHTVSDLAISAGVLAGALLAIFTALGAVIAGGASVPGVHRAVSAATWALLVAGACLPWHDIMPSMSFRGAFGDYAAMTALSEAVDAGAGTPLPMYTAFVLAPLTAFCGACLVLLRFRQGVAEGVIVTSVSELDERLEREMAGIRVSGVNGQGTTRAVAALNHAIGEKPEESGPAPASQGESAPPRKARTFPLSRIGRGLAAADDAEFRRPI
jgi:hypothetical protein